MPVTVPMGKCYINNLIIFIRDKPYSTIKPGQAKERDYYSKATHEKPNGEAVLQNFTRFESIYKQNVSGTT